MKGSQIEKRRDCAEGSPGRLDSGSRSKEHTRFLVLSTRGRRRLVDSAKRCRFFCQNPQEDQQCNPPQKGLGKQHSDREEAHTTQTLLQQQVGGWPDLLWHGGAGRGFGATGKATLKQVDPCSQRLPLESNQSRAGEGLEFLYP